MPDHPIPEQVLDPLLAKWLQFAGKGPFQPDGQMIPTCLYILPRNNTKGESSKV